MIDVSSGIRSYLLSIADDKHFVGQQHAEWIGVAPFLEEDLAFCSIGQDELGHAALIYELLVGDDDLAIDALAFGRSLDEYRSCWFVEQTYTEWAEALVRHWMFDTADALRWADLAQSSIAELAAIAARVEREEVFHRLHADNMLDALLLDAESSAILRSAASRLAPFALGMFDPVLEEAEAVTEGVVSRSFSESLETWKQLAEHRFGPLVWGNAPDQAHRTQRSIEFGALLGRMREVIEIDVHAVW